jgi:putative N-acetylmannosamine-6-phosphate epimerase
LRNNLEIFADIATLDEAKKAIDLGATYVATTMSGYTKDRAMTIGPDFELLEKVIALGGKTVLEGRVSTSFHIRNAFVLGAYAVVIGRAVTSPQTILREILGAV